MRDEIEKLEVLEISHDTATNLKTLSVAGILKNNHFGFNFFLLTAWKLIFIVSVWAWSCHIWHTALYPHRSEKQILLGTVWVDMGGVGLRCSGFEWMGFFLGGTVDHAGKCLLNLTIWKWGLGALISRDFAGQGRPSLYIWKGYERGLG